WVVVPPVKAVIIDSGDGTGNTAAPPSDPGFAHVGRRSSTTAVYLGNGWVLTAGHVGEGDVTLGGVTYPAVPSSTVRMTNPGAGFADLRVFEIQGGPHLPPLPVLPLAISLPVVGDPVLMIGNGRDRGAAVVWNGIDGWAWANTRTIRWGTNRVSDASEFVSLGAFDTETFVTDFDEIGSPGATADEAQAANGDSGGAVFVGPVGDERLAGIMVAVGTFADQPATQALYGNTTFVANVVHYRDQVIDIVRPDCSDELDNDGDGDVDFPDDAGCTSAEDLSESPDCSDGIDNDGDGLVDAGEDPGCADADDPLETNAAVVCDDGVDNDGDGLRDWPYDLGCRDALWGLEAPACEDGLDNDGDGLVDFDGGGVGDPDPQCAGLAWKNQERPRCGLGFESGVLLVAAGLLRRRRRATPEGIL
ncbi:MAG: hypothetical protein MJE66_16345, partial [Proteobacteria bacterium]|nr:hypothetical protein [Pseudomonadota bacterium]